MGHGRTAGRDQLDVGVGQVHAVGEDACRAPSSPVSWSTWIGDRPPWRAATWASSADRLAGMHVDPGAGRRGELADRPQLVLGQQVRAVRAHPAPVGGGVVEVAPSPLHAGRERAAVGAGELARRPGPSAAGSRVPAATALAASGKKYMSIAVVMPARRHSATASAVPAATVDADRIVPPAGSSLPRKPSRSRSSASPRNIVIARWVWVLTRPGTHDAATGVDHPSPLAAARRGGRTDGADDAAGDRPRRHRPARCGRRPSSRRWRS